MVTSKRNGFYYYGHSTGSLIATGCRRGFPWLILTMCILSILTGQLSNNTYTITQTKDQ